MKKIRVILLHEDPTILSVLANSEDFTIKRIHSIEQCAEAILTFKPHVILLSTFFPKLDGIKLLKKLKQETDIPVLIISDTQTSYERISAINCGADEFVCLPISIEELSGRIISKLKA